VRKSERIEHPFVKTNNTNDPTRLDLLWTNIDQDIIKWSSPQFPNQIVTFFLPKRSTVNKVMKTKVPSPLLHHNIPALIAEIVSGSLKNICSVIITGRSSLDHCCQKKPEKLRFPINFGTGFLIRFFENLLLPSSPWTPKFVFLISGYWSYRPLASFPSNCDL